LRILHFSNDGLPDWRIEKSAISASNRGHEVIFAGEKLLNYSRKTFSKIYEIRWNWRARRGIPFYWHSVKKQIERVIREVRPDIVHAHDLFPAQMISEFGLPFVYDDHEYWSECSKILAEVNENSSQSLAGSLPRKIARRVLRNVLNKYAINLWTKWEKRIVSSNPTITVSDKIAEELKAIGDTDNVFIVPNYPLRVEVKDFRRPNFHNNLSSAYSGSEGRKNLRYPHQRVDGLMDMFANRDVGDLTIIGWKEKSSSLKIKYTGILSRQKMFEEMSDHSIGLIPFKKHWAHSFMNPNRAYEYVHAGLFVMCTSSLRPVQETLKDGCATFEDYNDLALQLRYFKENMDELYNKRLKTFEFAHSNLIWENYEKNIFHAYQLC
jgi:hypothetical protein